MVATIKKEVFLNWYFNSGSDQEQKQIVLYVGRALKDSMESGGVAPTVQSLWDECNREVIPARHFEEYSDDNDEEIEVYMNEGNLHLKLIN